MDGPAAMVAWRCAMQNVRHATRLGARGESLAAFDGRRIPAGCVAPRSNTPSILGRRALPAGRLARLGATPDSRRGRDDGHPPPPAQNRTGRIAAYGSYLGCV